MSLRRVLLALLGLGLGLLFYLAHRSDYTLSNRLVQAVAGPAAYAGLKHELKQWLPVPPALRGSLPSALWCFIAASLVGGWKIRAGRDRSIALAWFCPLINASWEVIQWCGWTDGRGDVQDVAAGFVGWAVSQMMFLHSAKPVEVPALWSWRLGIVMSGFACMGLADVWK